MPWTTDRDAALAAATTAGTALANAYTLAKTSLATAQAGAGTGTDSRDWDRWRQRIANNVRLAMIAGGVRPGDARQILRFLELRR